MHAGAAPAHRGFPEAAKPSPSLGGVRLACLEGEAREAGAQAHGPRVVGAAREQGLCQGVVSVVRSRESLQRHSAGRGGHSTAGSSDCGSDPATSKHPGGLGRGGAREGVGCGGSPFAPRSAPTPLPRQHTPPHAAPRAAGGRPSPPPRPSRPPARRCWPSAPGRGRRCRRSRRRWQSCCLALPWRQGRPALSLRRAAAAQSRRLRRRVRPRPRRPGRLRSRNRTLQPQPAARLRAHARRHAGQAGRAGRQACVGARASQGEGSRWWLARHVACALRGQRRRNA